MRRVKEPYNVVWVVWVALVAVLGWHCDIETLPSGEVADVGSDAASGPAPIEERFVTESYGIGADWYDYESGSHVVTPRDLVYRLDYGDARAAFEVTSYYDERGESGFLSFRVRREAERGGWRPVETVERVGNIKKRERACLDLDAPAEVDCADGEHELVLRTDLRVVPAAGFAVQNPSIYTADHAPDGRRARLYVASADTLEASPDDWGDWRPLLDVTLDRGRALLADYPNREADWDATPLFVQATAAYELAIWRARPGDSGVTVEAWCTELKSSADEQGDVTPGAPEAVEIDWPEQGGVLVDLCGEDGPTRLNDSSPALRGMWPRTDRFDLVVERWNGRPGLRLPPGHFLWSTGRRDIGDGARAISVPEELWD